MYLNKATIVSISFMIVGVFFAFGPGIIISWWSHPVVQTGGFVLFTIGTIIGLISGDR